MALAFTPERELEVNLINQLVEGESQWIYRSDLTSEAALWDNLKLILERNNRAALNGVPLTEQEFWQVKTQLTFASFFDAATWLSGENGVAKVQVQREDAALNTIRLNVINRADIAGGTTVYEVINQYTSRKETNNDRNRRFDVTLLINGLPLIHIELKNRQHPYMDGFRQIKKYLQEGKFKGIYSAVQMFVVSNGTDTRYIAAASFNKLNESFLSKWVDERNEPVIDYLAFAKSVLSIPQAHKMVTHYAITDKDKKSLILLRPYQIHAIEAVKGASKEQKSGYVWHTTGSGKTLTSYKVASNLLQIPVIDKTLFIVDRIDLDQQTTSSFNAYAEFDPVSVDETDNVNDLINKLVSDARTVVITTIQKINHLMKRMANTDLSEKRLRQYSKIKELRVAFIVDECHRAVTPQKQQEINAVFHYALWYGFTGTPIFAENRRSEMGNLARTTESQYGKRLHEYTVKEAINDKAVLGFKVENTDTISDDDLDEIIAQRHQGKSKLTRPEKEKRLPSAVYENKQHYLEVIDRIINKSKGILGIKADGGGKAYGAILTVPSIAIAQTYYDLFKSVIAGNEAVNVSEQIKRILPDFPKVAITYSISENEESSVHNQQKMQEAIEDYNALYQTSYSLETVRAYNSNVNDRLSRKKEQYRTRNTHIDIIIVVDRLLTGFDAPCISTLFIDRPPMQPHEIIQAFSRTNRLFDLDKTEGRIVTFRTPSLYKEAIDNALKLYSNGGENYVLAPSWQESKAALDEAISTLLKLAPTPESITAMSLDDKKQFAKAYQQFDKALSAASVYTEFDEENIAQTIVINDTTREAYHGHYENVLEELRVNRTDEVEPEPFDIDYSLRTHRIEEINYHYILSLIQQYMPRSDQPQTTEISPEQQQKQAEIDGYITMLSDENPKLALMMMQLWHKIKSNPKAYQDKDIRDLLNEMTNETLTTLIAKLASDWEIDTDKLRFVVDNYNPNRSEQNGEDELRSSCNYEEYKTKTKNPVPKLRYWRSIKESYMAMIEQDVLPLRLR